MRCWVSGSSKRRLGRSSSVRARLLSFSHHFRIKCPSWIACAADTAPPSLPYPRTLGPASNTEQNMDMPGQILDDPPSGGGRTGTKVRQWRCTLMHQIFSCSRGPCSLLLPGSSGVLAFEPMRVSAQPALYCTYRGTFRPSAWLHG